MRLRITSLLLFCCLASCDSGSETTDPVLSPAAFALYTDAFPSDREGSGDTYAAASESIGFIAPRFAPQRLAIAAAGLRDVAAKVPALENGSRVWTGETRLNGSLFTFRLTAQEDGEDLVWQARAAGSRGGFDLFSARSNAEGTVGRWSLFGAEEVRELEPYEGTFDTGGATDVVRMESQVVSGRSLRSTKTGSEYGLNNQNENFGEAVRWNLETGAGQLRTPSYLGGTPFCWNSDLEDAPCP